MLNRYSAFTVRHSRAIFIVSGAVLLLTLLIRTGWASEDAFISFRIVDNFLAGYGLTWNPGERVQAYTHPLYLLLNIAGTWITGSAYWSSMILSTLLTIGSYFFLMYRRAESAIVIGTLILLSSKAFLDFSVSGLENPVTNFGIAAFCWAYWNKRGALTLTLIVSLSAVNRLDSILFFLPALLLTYYRLGWKAWKPALIGFSPLIAWELFALFYYGFPFPNTAYAKLQTGISSLDLMRQGLRYLFTAYLWDKVTAAAILAAIGVGIWAGEWPLVLGLVLSIAYVVRVGGDYMAGRFLCSPLLLACAIIVRYARLRPRPALGMSAAILVLGLVNPRPALTTTTSYGEGPPLEGSVYYGIGDERAFMYRASGILRWRRGLLWPNFAWSELGEQYRKSGKHVIELFPIGAIPYHAGPKVYVIDRGALADSFLARLPSMSGERRPGHYFRAMPAGYFETVSTGINQIQDPHLAEYYGYLHDIANGSLWSGKRLNEIVMMNLGEYDWLLPKYGTLTVDAEVSKGTRFMIFANDGAGMQRDAVVAGRRATYTFPIPDNMQSLRFDPSEAADAEAVIYSVTLELPGQPKRTLPVNELTTFLPYHCVVKMKDGAVDVHATGPDMYFMRAVLPYSYPVTAAGK